MLEWKGAQIHRWTQAEDIMHYGVPYLDDATRGIFPNDLVVMGAGTGVGKTQFATNVALKLSTECKRVLFFALEADKYEIQNRMLYSTIRKYFFQYFKGREHHWPRYVDWLAMGHDTDWESLENEALKELQLNTDGLSVVYQSERYTAEDFKKGVESLFTEFDLIIIDHIHYFDLMKSNEYEGLKQVVHTLREVSIKTSKPIIALAHLRKDRNRFPGLHDFHGHSDIVKVATNVILASHAPREAYESANDIFPTYLRIAKSRKAGEVSKYIGLTTYDTLKNEYSPKYVLCDHKTDEEDPEEIQSPEKIPAWAKNAKRPTGNFIGYRGRDDRETRKED